MSEIKIRPAISGDESAIHEAHMRSIREICVKDHGEEEIRGWGYRPLGVRWIEPIRNGYVWVVDFNNKINGFGYIRLFEKDSLRKAHIHGLYLTPEVLGRKVGLQLTQIMLRKASEYEARIVTLESSITAHNFYRKIGFRDTGPEGKTDIGGFPVTYFPMALILSD